MNKKPTKKLKIKQITELQDYLEELEWKQLAACGLITLNELIKYLTKDVSTDSEAKTLIERAGNVLVAISSRVGQDTMVSSKKLRELYGIEDAPVGETTEGSAAVQETPVELKDGESVSLPE